VNKGKQEDTELDQKHAEEIKRIREEGKKALQEAKDLGQRYKEEAKQAKELSQKLSEETRDLKQKFEDKFKKTVNQDIADIKRVVESKKV